MDVERKSRVAVSVFYDEDKLREALTLLKHSISLDCSITALAQIQVAQSMFFRDLAHEKDGLGAYALKYSEHVGEREPPVEQTLHFQDWIDSPSVSKLTGHVQHGACAMFVFYDSVIEETEVFRVLMKLAYDKVELHDLPPDSVNTA